MIQPYDDRYFMKQAYAEAVRAMDADEVPIGAVVTLENRIIARSTNQVEQLMDVTAHAEIIAVTAAANTIGAKYLEHCRLYVTLEPCPMCAGALYWSRIGHLIYGTEDEKRGFMRFGRDMLHPTTKIQYGLMRDECAELLRQFFQRKRH